MVIVIMGGTLFSRPTQVLENVIKYIAVIMSHAIFMFMNVIFMFMNT